MILKIGDLDLNLQGQIGLQLPKFLFVLLNIEPLQILPENLKMGLKTGDLDLQGRICLKLKNFV